MRMRRDYRERMSVFDLAQPQPLLGSDQVRNQVGMSVALLTLHASLMPGKYADDLQPDSVRCTQTWYNNTHQSGKDYCVDTIYAKDEKKLHVTSSVTAREWFMCFQLGCKLRTGQIQRQNEALTSNLVLALSVEAKWMWSEASDEKEKEMWEEVMCFALLEFGAVLRKEEVPLVLLSGLLGFWDKSTTSDIPHIMVTLKGKFKGATGHRWHCIPIAMDNPSGIPFKGGYPG
jgi:hypothetical protein